jgi:hypothetical protein
MALLIRSVVSLCILLCAGLAQEQQELFQTCTVTDV